MSTPANAPYKKRQHAPGAAPRFLAVVYDTRDAPTGLVTRHYDVAKKPASDGVAYIPNIVSLPGKRPCVIGARRAFPKAPSRRDRHRAEVANR